MKTTSLKLINLIILLGFLSFPACGSGQVDYGLAQPPIINGTIDRDTQAVVALVAWGESFCTGTLIAPSSVLTAGHCIAESEIPVEEISLFFGLTVGEAGETIQADQTFVHPDYKVRANGTPMNDVAVVTLTREATVAPMVWQRTPLDQSVVNQTVTLVGYGVTDAEHQTGANTRRKVDSTITRMDSHFIYYGDGVSGTCSGDSGGPMFLDKDGIPTIIGTASFGDATCVELGANTRVDTLAAFIAPHAIVPVTVAFTLPTDSQTVAPSFVVDVAATSAASIAEIDLYLDDSLQGSLTEPPWEFALTNIADGAHKLKAKATATDTGVSQASIDITVATPSGCQLGPTSHQPRGMLLWVLAALALLYRRAAWRPGKRRA